MIISTNSETLVAVHTRTHTDVQLENKNAKKIVAQKEKVNNFEFQKYNAINNIKKEVNSLCIQIHKLSLLSFLCLLNNYILQLCFSQKIYTTNEICTEGGNM